MNDKFLRVKEKLQRELGQTITQLLTEKDVVEIMLNPDGKLWVERLGQEMQPVGEMVASQAESLMATVASTINTTITSEKPILECELPIDGSRFEALIPLLSVHRRSRSVRKPTRFLPSMIMSMTG